MRWLGKKGSAVLDRWTPLHLVVWFIVGLSIGYLDLSRWWIWPVVLLGGYTWSTVEMALETLTGLELQVEGRLNRWVADPLMAVVGSSAGMYIV